MCIKFVIRFYLLLAATCYHKGLRELQFSYAIYFVNGDGKIIKFQAENDYLANSMFCRVAKSCVTNFKVGLVISKYPHANFKFV